MHSSQISRRNAWQSVVAAFIVAFLAGLTAGIPGASAQVNMAQSTKSAAISVIEAAVVAGPGQLETVIHLSGSVEGPGGTPFTITGLAGNRLSTRTELSEVLAGLAPGSLTNTSVTSAGTTNSAGQAAWTLDLPLPQGTVDGVYTYGAALSVGKEKVQITVPVPVFQTDSALDPTRVVFSIPLTTAAPIGASADAVANSNEVARLKELVSTSSSAGKHIDWLIDAQTNDWLTSVNTDESRTVLDKLSKLSGKRHFLPYAQARVDAVVISEIPQGLKNIQLLSGNDEGSTTYYIPSQNELITSGSLAASDLAHYVPLISNAAVQSSVNVTTDAHNTLGNRDVLIFDAAASDCLTQQSSSAQRFCLRSQLAMMTAEQPNAARSIIVLAPANWKTSSTAIDSLVESVTSESWVKPTSLDQISKTSSAQTFNASNFITPQPIARRIVNQTHHIEDLAQSFSSITNDKNFVAKYQRAIHSAWSAKWPSDSATHTYLQHQVDELSKLTNSISIQTSRTITVSTDQVDIPVTIDNQSDYEVSLGVTATSNTPSRFSVDPTKTITIAAHQRGTVSLLSHIRGAGDLTVALHVIDGSGNHFGDSQSVTIRPTAYTRIASRLVIVALGVLLLLSISNIVRRTRKN